MAKRAPRPPADEDSTIFIEQIRYLRLHFWSDLDLERKQTKHVDKIIKTLDTTYRRTNSDPRTISNAIGQNSAVTTNVHEDTQSLLKTWATRKTGWLTPETFDHHLPDIFQQRVKELHSHSLETADPDSMLLVDIFKYLRDKYNDVLLLNMDSFEATSQLAAATGLGLRQLRNIFQLDTQLTIVPRIVRKNIIEWLVSRMPWVKPTTFHITNFGAFCTALDNAMAARNFRRNIAPDDLNIVEIRARDRTAIVDIIKQSLHPLQQHFVGYRYAFGNYDGSTDIAREVFTFRPSSNRWDVECSFKIGPNTRGKKVRLFQGPAFVLGSSLICIATYEEASDPGQDRIRTIFMRATEPTETCECRFGLVTSTRAQAEFEPCAACILLFPLKFDLPDADLEEFRQKITVDAPCEDFLRTDFEGLPEIDRIELLHMLDNRPRGTHRDDLYNITGGDPLKHGDSIMRLHHTRFSNEIGNVFRYVINTAGVKAPIKANWKDGFVERV